MLTRVPYLARLGFFGGKGRKAMADGSKVGLRTIGNAWKDLVRIVESSAAVKMLWMALGLEIGRVASSLE